MKGETIMVYKISENQFNAEKLQKFESIACQGNGYIGVRNSLEEEYVNTLIGTRL